MRSRSTGVLTSAVLAFAVGYVLWPPGYVYWTRVADVLGEPLSLALVALLAAAGGAVATLRLAVPLAELVAGSVIAYAVGMALLEAAITADSPVHLNPSREFRPLGREGMRHGADHPLLGGRAGIQLPLRVE
ncbi:hypothetical protein [Natrinema thermotolerans]